MSSGINTLLANEKLLDKLRRQRVALLTNTSCRTSTGKETFRALNDALSTSSKTGISNLFVPEHGYYLNISAGNLVPDVLNDLQNINIYSLYGVRKWPTNNQFNSLDSLVIDLRDVGVRCFTYATTAALTARAALNEGIKVIVCDRINPIGTNKDGPTLDPKYRSFLAYFYTPFIHGQTIGSLLQDLLKQHPMSENLSIISGQLINHKIIKKTLPPSPSLQTSDSIQLYSGLVMLEGTNLSEGRGSPLSFRCVAAPWLKSEALADDANNWPTGVKAEACTIKCSTGQYKEKSIPAVKFEPTYLECDAFSLGIHLLSWISNKQPEFMWKSTKFIPLDNKSYIGGTNTDESYVIDNLLGDNSFRLAISRGESPINIISNWRT